MTREGWLEKMSDGMFPRWQVRVHMPLCRRPVGASSSDRADSRLLLAPCPVLHDATIHGRSLTRAGIKAQIRYVSHTRGSGLSLRHGKGDARCKLYDVGSGGGGAKHGEEDRILMVECKSGTSARTLKREAPEPGRARWLGRGTAMEAHGGDLHLPAHYSKNNPEGPSEGGKGGLGWME